MPDEPDRLLTSAEVAVLFRVAASTVADWADSGRLGGIKTPGKHWRFRESEIRALLDGEQPACPQDRIPRPLRSGDRAGPPPVAAKKVRLPLA